jgi:hypothetical protein
VLLSWWIRAPSAKVRTIQRIEAGQPAATESLKCLAAVFEVDFSTLNAGETMPERHAAAPLGTLGHRRLGHRVPGSRMGTPAGGKEARAAALARTTGKKEEYAMGRSTGRNLRNRRRKQQIKKKLHQAAKQQKRMAKAAKGGKA